VLEQRDFEKTLKIWPPCNDWNFFSNFQQKPRKIKEIHENFLRPTFPKCPKLPMIPRIFVRVLFGLQVGRPWLEQWENSENIKKKLSEFPDQKKATGKSFRAVGWQP
jgi:hypothetical protein